MSKQQAGNRRRAAEAKTVWADRKLEIVRLYESGLSQAALAEKYGVTLSGMQKAMGRLGIAPKPRARIGKANGRYVHGKATTIYRSRVTKRACAKCSATKDLCIHHLDDDHYNNDPKNLQVLCMSCHSRMHKRAWWAARKSSS